MMTAVGGLSREPLLNIPESRLRFRNEISNTKNN